MPTSADPGSDGEDGPREIEGRNAGEEVHRAVSRITPGRPSAENAAFVVLGALAALFVLARVAGLV